MNEKRKRSQVDTSSHGKDVHAPEGNRLYSLVLLMMIYCCHSIDRSVLAILIEPIKHEFHASDTAMGFIPLAYSGAFIVAMLPVGLLIDRMNRVRLLAALVGAWSLLTAMAGFAQNITLLILARMSIGAAEAGGQPTSLSLISDIFPQDKRSSALGVFYLATGLGGVVTFWIGGMVAAAYGWRATFFVAGVPGALLVVLMLATLREPRRGKFDAPAGLRRPASPPKLSEVMRAIFSAPAILHAMLGVLFGTAVLGGATHWMPAFLMRTHALDLKSAGAIVAVGNGLFLALGTIVAGVLTDRFAKGRAHRLAIAAAAIMIAGAVSGLIFTLTGSLKIAVALYFVFGLLGTAWLPAGYSFLLGQAAAPMRGSVMAVCQMMAALGSGFGPFLIGKVSDQSGGAIGPAIACGVSFGFWSALHWFFAARAARQGFGVSPTDAGPAAQRGRSIRGLKAPGRT